MVATGIHRGKKNDFKLAIRVQRRGFEDSPPIEAIRKKAKDEVDVRYIGPIVKRAGPWNRERERPLLIGSSIGHVDVTAGTLGCFVRKPGTKTAVALLSNNHVLANENSAAIGDGVIQPGAYDGGRPRHDQVGRLLKYVPLRDSGANTVDAALASIDGSVDGDWSTLHEVGVLSGVVTDDDLLEVEQVEKLGRTTGHTTGRITAFELDGVIVGYDRGQLRFDNQLEIEGAGNRAFSAGGDSGALIFTSGGVALACGLLFAGGDHGGSNGKGYTYANPIGTVMRRLKTKLVVA